MAATLAQIFADAQTRARAAPADLTARSTLWQVFAVRGELDRARKQLDMMLRLDASWAMEVQGCHSLLDAEVLRGEVFAGRQPPTCLGQPPSWFGALISALPMLAQDRPDGAAALLSQALDEATPCAGVLNGTAFDWICDGDARLGPCIEIIAQGRYVWVEIAAVRSLVCQQPQELRDLIWLPAKLEIDDSGALDIFVPARYPSPLSDDHQMARSTDWTPLAGELFIGHGQKCFSTNNDLTGFLDLRELRIGNDNSAT